MWSPRVNTVVSFKDRGREELGLVYRQTGNQVDVYDRRGEQHLAVHATAAPVVDIAAFAPYDTVVHDPGRGEGRYVTAILEKHPTLDAYMISPRDPATGLLRNIPAFALTRAMLRDVSITNTVSVATRVPEPDFQYDSEDIIRGPCRVGEAVGFKMGSRTLLGIVVKTDGKNVTVVESRGTDVVVPADRIILHKALQDIHHFEIGDIVHYTRRDEDRYIAYDTQIVNTSHNHLYTVLADVPYHRPYARVPATAIGLVSSPVTLLPQRPLVLLPTTSATSKPPAVPPKPPSRPPTPPRTANKTHDSVVKEEGIETPPGRKKGKKKKRVHDKDYGGPDSIVKEEGLENSPIKPGDAVLFWWHKKKYPSIVVDIPHPNARVMDETGELYNRPLSELTKDPTPVPVFEVNDDVIYHRDYTGKSNPSVYKTRIHSHGLYPHTYNVFKDFKDTTPYFNIPANALRRDKSSKSLQAKYDRDVQLYFKNDAPHVQKELERNRDRLEIRLSTLPNAGLGLFASRDIEKDQILGQYKGIMATPSDILNPKSAYTYVLHEPGEANKYTGKDGLLIDAGPIYHDNLVKFANDCDRTSKDPQCHNARFEIIGPEDVSILVVRSTRPIRANEEVVAPYGKDYWDTERDHPHIVPTILRVLQHNVSPSTHDELRGLLVARLADVTDVKLIKQWTPVIREVFYDWIGVGKPLQGKGLSLVSEELEDLAARTSPLRPLLMAAQAHYEHADYFIALCASAALTLDDFRDAALMAYDMISKAEASRDLDNLDFLNMLHYREHALHYRYTTGTDAVESNVHSTYEDRMREGLSLPVESWGDLPLDHLVPAHGLWAIILLREYGSYTFKLTRDEMEKLLRFPRKDYAQLLDDFISVSTFEQILLLVKHLQGRVGGLRFRVGELPFDHPNLRLDEDDETFVIWRDGKIVWRSDNRKTGWQQLYDAMKQLQEWEL